MRLNIIFLCVILTSILILPNVYPTADAICFWCWNWNPLPPVKCTMPTVDPGPDPCMASGFPTVDVGIERLGTEKIKTQGLVDKDEGILIGVNKDMTRGLVLKIVSLNDTINQRQKLLTQEDVFYGFSNDLTTRQSWKINTSPNNSTDKTTLDTLSEIWKNPPKVKRDAQPIYYKNGDLNKTSEGSSNEKVWDQPVSSKERPAVPEWIKKNADWYGKGQITENDFVQGLEWMINNGIIQIFDDDGIPLRAK